MFPFLKNHPFAVEAHFERSLVLTFAVPASELQHRIPECLALDVFNGKWAFIAVAMVQTTNLRPKGFPHFFGNSFFLIGYRIFVRYTTNTGKRLRGLYIIKSETDKRKMEWLGNIFTQYHYSTTDISQLSKGTQLEITSIKSDFTVSIDSGSELVALPPDSPFTGWKEARRFAGPLPFTFTYNQRTKRVLLIEGVRQYWQPKPVKVIAYTFSFLNALQFSQVVLASAFEVNNIPYFWKKGRVERWNG